MIISYTNKTDGTGFERKLTTRGIGSVLLGIQFHGKSFREGLKYFTHLLVEEVKRK